MKILRVVSFCFVAASAVDVCAEDDECSMLQVEVTDHSSQEVTSALASIGQEIQSIAVPDTSHRVALDTLMRTVARENKLSPSAKDTLINVTAILQGLLPHLKTDRDEKDLELLAVNAAVDACNDASVTATVARKTTSDDARDDHNTCRQGQQTAHGTQTDLCNELTFWMNGISHASCDFPGASRDNFLAWSLKLSEGQEWFKDRQDAFNAKDGPCDDAQVALTTKASECDQSQENFEQKYCLWHSALNDMCTNRQTCYNGAIAIHNANVARITPLSEQRVKDAGVINHVICLINNLVAGNTDLTACNDVGTDSSEYTGDFANNFPNLPQMDECDTSVADVHPGSPSWNDVEYGSLPPDAPHTDTGINDC